MKVALCLFGLVGSKQDKNGVGEPLDPKIAGALNLKNVIDINQADVFIHSWSMDAKEELIKFYEPKACLVEKQKDFPNARKLTSNVDFKLKLRELPMRLFKRGDYKRIIEQRALEAFRACSRWYSTQSVIELKNKYEEANGFKYDAIILLRLDAAFYTALDLKKYDLRKFYASHWNDYPTSGNGYAMNYENHHVGRGFLDFWFFGNNSDMTNFGMLFRSISQYNVSPHRSSYEHAAKLGLDIAYTMYRWQDHEMIRRKEFNAKK